MDSALERLKSHPSIMSVEYRDDLNTFSSVAGRYGLEVKYIDGKRRGVRSIHPNVELMAMLLLDEADELGGEK